MNSLEKDIPDKRARGLAESIGSKYGVSFKRFQVLGF
jgi:hypothetical protein